MADSIVIKTDPPGDDPKHVQAMVDAVDKASQPATEEASKVEPKERPEWVPEKFWDAETGEVRTEDLAKSYKELESGKGKAEEKKVDPPADEAAAKAALDEKGLNFDDFSAEFAKDGALSEASYEKLEKAGIPKAMVDQYVEGQKALASAFEADVKSQAGGPEKFSEMVEWAAAGGVSKEEIAAYNKAIDSRDVNQAKLAVAGLFQKFQDAGRGDEPNLLKGAGGAATADVYESVAQLQKDMASKEYKTDPAFRAKVQAKLGRSDIL